MKIKSVWYFVWKGTFYVFFHFEYQFILIFAIALVIQDKTEVKLNIHKSAFTKYIIDLSFLR